MRFFRSASDAAYEQARMTLDASWGLPNDRGTATCIEPAATAPRDSQGRIVLAVDDAFCEYPEAAALLPQLLASGAAVEIGMAEYVAAVNWIE
jgi:hypothetical protein